MKGYNLYRRYRPQNFEEVVGQDIIVQTLNNAIAQDKIAHAYIFNGPRGTGKTSIAKIFSKKINNFNDNLNHPDIVEMDAASHNGVDEIRKIIENVSYVPIEGKYKVYIIDEVHMLSKGAFNALLKTLEDPPNHAIFILATTEINKVPTTILSRCQRFDFARINIPTIIKQLKNILDQEEILYEEEALEKIADLGDGSMRDSLTILEKVITYNPDITLHNVLDCFKLISLDNIYNFIDLLKTGQEQQAISLFDQLYNQGMDLNFFIELVLEQLKKQIVHNYDTKLVTILTTLNELCLRMQYSNNHKLLIEVYIIEICAKNKDEIEKLETEVNEIKTISEQNVNSKDEELTNKQVEYNEEVYEDNVVSESEEEQQVEKDVNVKSQSITHSLEFREISLMDVLTTASKEAKENLKNLFVKIVQDLENNKKYGLAKFFNVCNIHAVGQYGCVITLDPQYYHDYIQREDEINQILKEYVHDNFKLFLLETEYWVNNVKLFRSKVKEVRENQLYVKTKKNFPGIEIIRS